MRTQMLKSVQKAMKRASSISRTFTSTSKNPNPKPNPERKVTVIGAAGVIGQPLSMFLKLNPLISSLSLFDLATVPGVAADLSLIPTRPMVVGHDKHEDLEKALSDSDVVIIFAGLPKRRHNMTCDELLFINASIVKHICVDVAKYCPKALVNIVSNPVNSIVPVAAEVFKKAGTYDPKRLFGVTTLDVLRARTLYASKVGVDPEDVTVPVVGGHEGNTTLPLFSQAVPQANLSDEEIEAFTERTQKGITEVSAAKNPQGSTTISTA